MSETGKVTRQAFELFTATANKVAGTPVDLTGPRTKEERIKTTQILITGRDTGFTGKYIFYNGIEAQKTEAGAVSAIEEDPRSWGSASDDKVLLRGRRNQRIPIGSVVNAHQVTSGDDIIWEIDFEIETNKSFLFLGQGNGNTDYADKFIMSEEGAIITNYGVFIAGTVPSVIVNNGQRCWIEITALKDSTGDIAGVSGEIVVDSEKFPDTRRENDDLLIITIPIAEVRKFNATGYLVQYQCNDVFLDVSTQGTSFVYDPLDPNPIVPVPTPVIPGINVDDKWIKKRNRNQIYHSILTAVEAGLGPGDDCNWKYLKLLSNDFDCSTVAFSDASVTALRDDVQNWVNNVFLAEIKRVLVDAVGHIYECADCDGSNPEYGGGNKETDTGYTPVPTGVALTLTIENNDVEVEPGDQIDLKSLVTQNGADFTDWNAGGGDPKEVTYKFSINGVFIKFWKTTIADAELFKKEPIDALGGAESGDESTYYPLIECYYNSTCTVSSDVAGTGIGGTDTFTTKIVNMAASINLSELADVSGDKTGQLGITFDLTDSVAAAFTDFDADGIHVIQYTAQWASDGEFVEIVGGELVGGEIQAASSVTISERVITTDRAGEQIEVSGLIFNNDENCFVNIQTTVTVVPCTNYIVTSGASFSTVEKKFGSASMATGIAGVNSTFEDIFIGSDDFDLSFFVKFSSAPTEFKTLWGVGNGGGGWSNTGFTNGHLALVFYDYTASKLEFQWETPTVFQRLISTSTVTLTGSFHYIQVQRSGGTIDLRVDGSSVASTSSNTTISKEATTGTTQFIIGRSAAPVDKTMDGWLDDFVLADTIQSTTVPVSARTADTGRELIVPFDETFEDIHCG